MSDFDPESAQAKQRETLTRVEKLYKTLKEEVVDYYWNRQPESNDEVRSNEEVMYRYLKDAYHELDRLLSEEDKDLGY